MTDQRLVHKWDQVLPWYTLTPTSGKNKDAGLIHLHVGSPEGDW